MVERDIEMAAENGLDPKDVMAEIESILARHSARHSR
jgi:hypothetical protein